MSKHLYTSDIARATGVHPNTVRLYEAWGFLPSIPRSASGYRLFTAAHLAQMQLARIALRAPYTGDKRLAVALVRKAAAGELDRALAQQYLDQIRGQQAEAEAAIEFVDRWLGGQVFESVERPLRIGEAAWNEAGLCLRRQILTPVKSTSTALPPLTRTFIWPVLPRKRVIRRRVLLK